MDDGSRQKAWWADEEAFKKLLAEVPEKPRTIGEAKKLGNTLNDLIRSADSFSNSQSLEDQKMAALVNLWACLGILQFGDLRKHILPALRLVSELDDYIFNSARPELIAPEKRRSGNPDRPTIDTKLIGAIVATHQFLVALGESKENAARDLAKLLSQKGYTKRGGGGHRVLNASSGNFGRAISYQTILGWVRAVEDAPNRPTTPKETHLVDTYRNFEQQLRQIAGTDEEKRKYALSSLGRLIGDFKLSPPRTTDDALDDLSSR